MTPVLLPGTDTAESTSAFLESIGARAIGIPPGAVKWEPESEELAWKYDAWGFSLTDSGKAAVASLSPNTPVLLGIPPDPDSAALLYGTAIAAGLPIAGIIPIASLAPRDLKKWLGSPLPLEDVRSLVTAGLCRLALAYAFASIISIHWSRVSWYQGTLPGIVSLKPLSMLILSGISKSKWRRANHPDGRRWKMYSTVGHHRYYIRYDVIPDNDPAHVDEAGRIKDPDYAAELWRNSGGFGHGRNSEEKLSLKPPTLLSFSDLVVSFSKKDPTVLHELMPSLRRLWIQGLITWPFNDSKKVPDWAWDRKEEICSGIAMLSDRVAVRLRRAGMKAAGVSLAIRDPDFRDISRQRRLEPPTCLARELSQAAVSLAEGCWNMDSPVRALTVTALYLISEDQAGVQLDLLGQADAPRRDRLERLDRTLDQIRAKYGRNAISPASSAGVCQGGVQEEDEEGATS